MNIAEIKQLEVKEYVKGPVEGVLTNTKAITDTMSAGTLTDSTGDIDLTAFTKDVTKYDGQTIVLTGMGMRRDERGGYDKLTIGEKTKITTKDGPPAEAPLKSTPVVHKTVKPDDDFVPQTLAYFVGHATHFAIQDPDNDGQLPPKKEVIAAYLKVMYEGRELAVEGIRSNG